jgi:hypothetical protein
LVWRGSINTSTNGGFVSKPSGGRRQRHVSAGLTFQLPAVIMRRDRSTDSDQDGPAGRGRVGHGNDAENPDTDGDGVPDGAEVRAGSNATDGLPVATGVIGTADTPGTAKDVAARNNYAAVADGSAGVSIFNVQAGFTPTLVARVDTPGDARAVALLGAPTSADVLRVAVADGPSGLAVVDLELPANGRITQQVNLGSSALCVTLKGGLAYVGLENGTLVVVDTYSGAIMERLDVRERISMSGSRASALRGRRHPIARLLTDRVERWQAGCHPLERLPGGDHPATPALSGNHVRLRHLLSRLRRHPHQRSGRSRARRHRRRGRPEFLQTSRGQRFRPGRGHRRRQSPQRRHHISLYNVSDPTQTSRFLTTLQTPGIAHAVTLYNGLAYVADGEAGLQVVNYLAYDTGRIPPTISLTTDFPLDPPTAEEGKLVEVTALASDDVQVARVQFFVNGVLIGTDGSFPFTQQYVTPLIDPNSISNLFTLRARAFDTGGNSAWSTEYRDAGP